jgi:glycosyltransferase involved in cell wall biosynthesis
MLEATQGVVSHFPDTKYVVGPRRGVCANRNCALSHLTDVDYVACIDDDGFVSPDYLAIAHGTYDQLSETQRSRTILTGTRIDGSHENRGETTCRIDFRCYFVRSEIPEVAAASYSVYPRSFFERHPWDEQLFFGYEDAELSLRALKDGYKIVHVPNMVLTDAAPRQSTILEDSGRVTGYDFHGEAARLYVGVKRYKDIEPNYAKLAAFVPLFVAQITYSLAKRRSLHLLPKIVRQSNVIELFRRR